MFSFLCRMLGFYLCPRLRDFPDRRLASIEPPALYGDLVRPATIPGVGEIIALTLATEVDPMAFESGRHLAAWIGLTPKEHSTRGMQRMGGIIRAGNERLKGAPV